MELFYYWDHITGKGSALVLQAKLHVALDLGEAGGDQGYSFGEGPVAAGGRKPGSTSGGGPTKEIEMQGVGDDSAGRHEEDSSLQHNAAQVGVY